MKKLMALAIAVLMVAALCAIPAAAAEGVQIGDMIEYASEKNDEVLNGEAGEATIKWDVPYQSFTPKLDGVIEKSEYKYRFENFEDYVTFTTSKYDAAAADELYNKVKDGFFDVYWCWDGQYLYMAFDVDCVDGYNCTPTQDVMLFAYNCLQLGFADVDATGRHESYTELGFGYNNETEQDITFTWAGQYLSADEDFKGNYNPDTQRVTYELRVDLQQALGWDHYPENGEQCNFAYVLEVAGAKDETVNAQALFCQGIGGQFSMKMCEYFARITFTGKPDDIQIEAGVLPSISEEDLLYELRESIDFSSENVFSTMKGEGAKMEQITEEGETFLRITAEADGCYVYSTSYPRNLLSDARYLVVKYRTSSELAEEVGVLWQTRHDQDFHLDECYFDFMTTDGNWNYLMLDMNGEGKWMDYIQMLGFAPFYDEESVAGEVVDIAWVKCYNQDPYELFEQYMPTEPEVTTEADTQAPDATVDGSEATTEANTEANTEATTEAKTEANTEANTEAKTDATTEAKTEAPAEKNGCKGIVAVPVVVMVAMLGVAFVAKKKD